MILCARSTSRSSEQSSHSESTWKVCLFYSQNNKIVWLSNVANTILRNSRGAQRFVGFFLDCAFRTLIGWTGKVRSRGWNRICKNSLIAVWGLKKLSVFIFTSGSSAILGRSCCGLSIWLSLLAIFNTLIISLYQFVSRENGQNTKILVIFRMMRNGHRRLLGVQSINTERTSLICTLPLSSVKEQLGFYLGPCICFGVKGSYKIQQSCRHESIESGLNWVLLFSVIQQRLCWPRIKRQL